MGSQSRKTREIKLRIPIGIHSVIETYAAGHELNRTQAYLHFIEQGIKAETGEAPATKSDLVAFAASLEKTIKDQPIAIQETSPKLLADGNEWKEKGLIDRIFKR